MAELEERLSALGTQIEYPSTPRLAMEVRRHLEAPDRRQRFESRHLAIAAAILIVTVGALLAFPSTRDAIAGFFGLKGVIIQRVPSMRSPTPNPPGSVGQRLGLGRQIDLGEAQAAVPYVIAYPQSLGAPDAVFLLQPPERNAVALLWSPRADLPRTAQPGVGALVIEFPGQVQADFFLKMLGPDATLEAIRVKGNPGYWISGKPHGFFFLDQAGAAQQDTFRLAGNVILWDQGSLTIRIESALDKARAQTLAESTN